MARQSNKLSARKVETLKAPGRYSDGNGLFLKITGDGRRWTFLYTWRGKRVELGLGSARSVTLAKARERAQSYRELLSAGIDPRTVRKQEAAIPTFGEMADSYIADHQGGWRNDKHVRQWRTTLSRRRDDEGNLIKEGYCLSIVGLPVNEVSTEDVLRILKPIWLTKPETAARVRGRIEAVLNAAKALGHRSGENPALWRGHLSNLLPKRRKLSRGHHAAMPFDDVPALLKRLLEVPSCSNLALAFTILTAARSGETMGMRWPEVDLDEGLWRVPPERMKSGRPHTVPLSAPALEILEAARGLKREGNPLVFPGAKSGPLSVMALAMALRRAGGGDYTVHGMRSSFRDWCGDRTAFQRDDVELCLAHTIRDETERAYRRSDALEKRRAIMDAWAALLKDEPGANVVSIAEHREAAAQG